MRIIDPHVHVWVNDPAYPWAPDNPNPPAEDATCEMLLEEMARNGTEKTVLVQVIHYKWDNRYAGDCLRKYPGPLRGRLPRGPGESGRGRRSEPLGGGIRFQRGSAESGRGAGGRLVHSPRTWTACGGGHAT